MTDSIDLDTKEAFSRIGHFFVCATWIQSQMAHLNVFADDRSRIGPFLENPDRVPKEIHLARLKYLERDFSFVLKRFGEHFRYLFTDGDWYQLNLLSFYRNAIAHAFVSLGRKYVLYRPSGDVRAKEISERFHFAAIADQSDPAMFKVDFSDENTYVTQFNLMITFADQVCMRRVCEHIGLQHSRIR